MPMTRVASVTDPAQREATYYLLADRWSRRDPDAFRKYLENTENQPTILSSFLE